MATTPMHKISNSEKENRRVSGMELMPLSTPVIVRQEEQQIHEIIKEDNTFLKLPDTSHSRLNLMLEIIDDTQTSNDNVLASNASLRESNIEKCCTITNVRSTSGGASIDSPHPIKNCQIHCNKGHDKIIND